MFQVGDEVLLIGTNKHAVIKTVGTWMAYVVNSELGIAQWVNLTSLIKVE